MDQSPVEGNRKGSAPAYRRHQPEKTCLYQLVERHWPEFQSMLEESGRYLPHHVTREFEKYLKCGLLSYGFLRIRCTDCGQENLVAYSCKCRGFCTSCGARRMAKTTALLIDDVLPHKPFRQWVLSIPWPLRLLLANNPRAMGKVLAVVIRSIRGLLADNADVKRTAGRSGGVTLIQRFGSALNLNPIAARFLFMF